MVAKDAQHPMYRKRETSAQPSAVHARGGVVRVNVAVWLLLAGAAAAVLGSGCTGSPGTFHLTQQNEIYNTSLEVTTKIDLLWVVDNSSSMDVEQQRLRDGFAAFPHKYMQPTWDIR